MTPTIHSCSQGSSDRNLIVNLKQVPYSCHVCSPAWLAQLSPYILDIYVCASEKSATLLVLLLACFFLSGWRLPFRLQMGCIRWGLMGARLQRNGKHESWTIHSCYGSFIWDPSGVKKAVLYRTKLIHVLSQVEQN